MKIRLLLLLAGAMPLVAQPYSQNPKPVRDLSAMEPVLAKIAAWQYNQSREPLYDFGEFVQSALASPAQRRQIEARLLEMLQSNATLAGKDFACRQLSFIGTEASVPVLSGMVARPETSDMARYALERIPGAAAVDALRKALESTSGRAKIGVINSLGARRDAGSVPALKLLIASTDQGISEAAMAALAGIADRAALNALATARSGLGGTRRLRASEAYLRCAGQLAAEGNKADALQVYRKLSAPEEPEAIRVVALGGLASVAGTDAVAQLQAELASPSPVVQAAAIRLLSGMPGPQITRIFVQSFPKLPAAAQVRILAALGDRRDASARPLVTGALKSSEPAVRTGALLALATIGDGSNVMALAEAAAQATGREQEAARQSLNTLRGADVEGAIVAGIGSASGGARLELIRTAGERGLSAAAGTLVRAAQDPAREVRSESLRALRTVAGPAQAADLLALLLADQGAADRRETASALAAALKRSEQSRVAEVVAAYQSARNPQIRIALLDVMGQASSDSALPVLRSSLADTDPEIARAAILALSDWLTPAPLPDLLAVAKNGSTPTLQILALRGYIKLIAAPSNRSMSETVKMLGEAMRLAQQPQERRSVLSLLPGYPNQEALQIAEAAAADSAIEREARSVVSRIKLSLGAEARP